MYRKEVQLRPSIKLVFWLTFSSLITLGVTFLVKFVRDTNPIQWWTYRLFVDNFEINYILLIECIHLSSRLTGTVVGVEDHDPIRWTNSEWRCLKVVI